MGKYHCNVDLLFNWFGISCMTTDIFCFYLQNRLIQTSQTGGQQYNDTSPFSIPWSNFDFAKMIIRLRFLKPNHKIPVENPQAVKACQKNDISNLARKMYSVYSLTEVFSF